MAGGPFDYTQPLQVQSPAAAVAAGLQTGQQAALGAQNVEQNRNLLAEQALKVEQTRIAMQQAAEQRRDLAILAQNPNPTARDYAQLVLKYPALKDNFKASFDRMDQEKQKQNLAVATPIYAAISNGRADLAANLLQEQIDAETNSGGDPNHIRSLQTWKQLVEGAPKQAQTMGALYLASVMGPEKFEANFGKLGSESREQAKLPSTIRATTATAAKTEAEAGEVAPNAAAARANISSEIDNRAQRLMLDRDKLTSEVQLKQQELNQKAGTVTEDARKIINSASESAVLARNTAEQARQLAGQFEKLDAREGVAGAVREKLREWTGSEDYISQLRSEYTRIRSSNILKNLPQGPASDKDVAFAMKGFLAPTADAKQVAQFLRGMAKMQDWQAQYDDAKGEWVAAVGHEGKALKDVEVNGIKVPAGYTLSEFVKQTMKPPGAETQAPQPGAQTDYLRKYGTPQQRAPQG